MRIANILKPALFIYECVRVIILSFTLALRLPAEAGALPWMAFTLTGALFPLMALFIWIDVSRYKPYLPLFTAGKCIGVLSLLGWLIIFRQVTMIQALSGVYMSAELIFGSGDLLALAAVLLIFKSTQTMTEKQALNETRSEDK